MLFLLQYRHTNTSPVTSPVTLPVKLPVNVPVQAPVPVTGEVNDLFVNVWVAVNWTISSL